MPDSRPSPRPWSEEEIETIRRVAEAGGTVSDAARKVGRTRGSVATRSARSGISFGLKDPKRRRAAEKHMVTAAERRVAMIARVYDQAEALVARMEATEHKTLIRAKGGGQQSTTLAFLPAEDVRNLGQAVSGLLGSAARLEGISERKDEISAQRSMVTDLMQGLRASRDAPSE